MSGPEKWADWQFQAVLPGELPAAFVAGTGIAMREPADELIRRGMW